MKTTIAVLGAGTWGTALAIVLARNGNPVHLWGRNVEDMQTTSASRINHKYMPDVTLPDEVKVFSDLSLALAGVNTVLLAVPSRGITELLAQVRPLAQTGWRFISAIKGLEPKQGRFLHEVISDNLGTDFPFAVIAGPSFAREVAHGLPTAITVASETIEYAKEVCELLHSSVLRPYFTTDLLGAEIGGIVKNVIAIGVGISDGLGYGANARSALITRGLAEMLRLSVAIGGQRETITGLAGLGDLVLTCTDNQSRNRRFGLALGEGKSVAEATRIVGQVVEGAQNTMLVHQLAKRKQIDMPITEQVYQILQGKQSPRTAVSQLFMRAIKTE